MDCLHANGIIKAETLLSLPHNLAWFIFKCNEFVVGVLLSNNMDKNCNVDVDKDKLVSITYVIDGNGISAPDIILNSTMYIICWTYMHYL